MAPSSRSSVATYLIPLLVYEKVHPCLCCSCLCLCVSRGANHVSTIPLLVIYVTLRYLTVVGDGDRRGFHGPLAMCLLCRNWFLLSVVYATKNCVRIVLPSACAILPFFLILLAVLVCVVSLDGFPLLSSVNTRISSLLTLFASTPLSGSGLERDFNWGLFNTKQTGEHLLMIPHCSSLCFSRCLLLTVRTFIDL